jgi:hypothetical protein
VAGVALPPPAPFGGVRAGGVRPGRPGMAAWIGDGGSPEASSWRRVPGGVIVAQEGVGDSSTAIDKRNGNSLWELVKWCRCGGGS